MEEEEVADRDTIRHRRFTGVEVQVQDPHTEEMTKVKVLVVRQEMGVLLLFPLRTLLRRKAAAAVATTILLVILLPLRNSVEEEEEEDQVGRVVESSMRTSFTRVKMTDR